jgi:hypothetical protein
MPHRRVEQNPIIQQDGKSAPNKLAPSKLDLARVARQTRCAFSPTLKTDIVDSIKAHLFEKFMSENALSQTHISVDELPVVTKLADGGVAGGIVIHFAGGSKGTDYEIISVFIDTLTDLAIAASKVGIQFFVKDDSFRVTANSTRDLVMLLNQAIINKKFKIKFTAEDEAYCPLPSSPQ